MQDLTPQQIIERDRARLATALQSGVNQNPDEVAGVRREAKARGIPPEAVQQMRAAKTPLPPALTSWYDMPETAPRTSRFLGQPQNAAVAHDDIQNLSEMEKVLAGGQFGGQELRAPRGRAASWGSFFGGLGAAFRDAFSPEGSVYRGSALALQDALANSPLNLTDATGNRLFTPASRETALDRVRQAQGELAAARPEFDSRLANAAYGGVESTIRMSGGLAASILLRNPTPALVAAGVQTGGEAYGRYAERGATPGEAALGATGEAAVEVATELIPMKLIVDMFGAAGAKNFLMKAGQAALAEVPGEQIATAAQDAIDTAIANPDKTWSDYLAERPGAAVDTFVATIVQAGLTAGAGAGVNAANRYVEGRAAQAAQAETDGGLVDKLNAVAEASKLRERDPESFEQFMQELTEDGPADTLYVAAETFAQSVEAAGLDMAQVRESVPAVAEQIDNALRDGGDLAIPTEQFAARIAGTELAQPLLDHLRIDPSLPSRAEVKALGGEANAQLEAEVEAVLTAEATTDAFRQSAERVKQSLLDQLNTAGWFTADVNAAYASLPTAYYTVRAAQLGITPEEMAARYPLQVRAELPTATPARSLDQGRLPASSSLALPDAPTPEVMERAARVERVPLSAARATQSVMDFERFDRRDSPGPVVPGYEDKPVAVRREDGEYLIYDGHHRAVRAAQAGNADMEMYVVDAKDYAPELAGRAPAQNRDDTDVLLAELGVDFNQAPLNTQTEAFRNWFGDSKVVDENGEPLVVYHGTNQQIEQFDAGRLGNSTRSAAARLGFFFTSDQRVAELYADHAASTVVANVEAFEAQRDALQAEVARLERVAQRTGKAEAWQAYEDAMSSWEELEIEAMRADDTGQNVVSVYLSIQNPKIINFDGKGILSLDGGFTGTIEAARDEGHDGLILRNIDDTPNISRVSDHYVAFDPAQIKSIYNEGTFDPSDPRILKQRNRGQIAFGADITQSPSVISLLRTADLSTFLHETGHFFLEVDAHIASQPDAPAEIVEDVNRLLAWFGVPDLATWNAMGLEEKRQYHEQFARGFEAYLFEGRAPTQELRGLFQRFSAWLKNVYRQLISNLNVELTDEVRGVMDRMVAAQEAIRETQDELNLKPIAESRPPFMSEEAWSEYQRSFADATAAAEGELETRLTRDMRWASSARSKALKRLQAQANAQRRQVRAEVTAEVNAEPVNRARRYLTHGLDENGEPIPGAGKLDLDILREMYGDGETALWRRLRRGGKFGEAGNNGLHPDVVAELFGFDSGDALVRALVEGENAQQKIAGLTDQRMLERYGDIADPQSLERAADEAVSNGVRARVVATEFAALAQATGQPRALAAAAKQHAAAIVNRMPLRRLKPQQFFASSARAARLADQAIRKVDLRAAAAQKRNQLVNLQAARYTLEAKAEVDKGLALFKRILAAKDENLARSRDMALVNTVRAILGQYGLTRAKNDPLSYLERVKSYDPQLYEDIKAFLALGAANAKPFDTMSYEEFQGMYETVRQLWTLSRRTRQIEIDGKLVDLETARAALGGRLDELGYPDQSAGHARAPTDKEKFGRQLQGARAALRRVESWARGIDGADTGPFRRYIWNPVSVAADQYRVAAADYMQRFLELVKPIEADLAKKQKIAAPEIGYTFNNKAELLHAILHTGNQSNLSKLLLGRKWGRKNADGSLDTSSWDSFVQRLWDEGVLTKAHYDFAQSVWDLLETTKPGAQRAHHATYGRYFDEIAADEVVTPFGTYRGGYVPATTDQFMVQDAALRAEQEAIEDSNSAMFPAASNGFTKSRVEDYTRELALDVRLLPMHIDKVLKFTYLGPPVRDVARILKGREFSQKLQAFDPVAQSDLLLPWLQRAAKQIVQTPTTGAGGKLIDTFFRELRSRTGMQLMFANLSNVAQQVTGVATLKLRVKQRHLNAALWRYMRGPKQTAEAVTGLSAMMATRTNTQIFEAKQTIEQMLLNPSKYEKLRDFSKAHAYYFQSAAQNITDIVGWSAAYDQAVAEGIEEAEAIRFADSVIRETQGSMAPEDVARFETGPAFVRLFNQFYSFFNNLANLNATEFQIVARGVGVRKGAGRLFYVYLMGFAVQAAIGDAIAQAFRGGWEDEDDDGYLDDLLLWFLESQVKFAVAMVPGVGQAANALYGAFTPEPYDDRVSVSPAVSSIESSVRVPAEVYQSIVEGESFNRRDIRDTFNLLGLLTGTPAGVLGRPVGYAVGVAQGDIEPTGPLDTARGLVTGNPSPESRTN